MCNKMSTYKATRKTKNKMDIWKEVVGYEVDGTRSEMLAELGSVLRVSYLSYKMQ